MFITDSIAISPQDSFSSSHFEIEEKNTKKYLALEPNYKGLIPPNLLRRMGRSVKFGVAAGKTILARNTDPLDGIILATANGGVGNALKFLNEIVKYEEGTLLPTSFIHASPNSVAGSLAVISETRKYNNTHVNLGNAFENALLDVKMQFELHGKNRILLGATEEISDFNYRIEQKAGYYKNEECNSNNLLDSNTAGSIAGEGASMFLIEKENKENSIEILDVDVLTTKLTSDINQRLDELLRENSIDESDLDSLILGVNGDNRLNKYYDLVKEKYLNTNQYCFKNLCGEYPTAMAFGLWYANKCLKNNSFHKETSLSDKKRKPKNVLIYNTYLGDQHGFILLRV